MSNLSTKMTAKFISLKNQTDYDMDMKSPYFGWTGTIRRREAMM